MPAIAQPLDGLPEQLLARPFVARDAEAFTAMYAAAELHDAGEAAIELADVVSDWARPSLDLARHSIGVWDGDQLVAGSDVYRTRRADGAVLPSHRGRGIGSALARWTQAVCAADGGTRVGMTVPAGSVGETVFADLGYHRGWTSWVLQLPADAEIAVRPLPDGYLVRDADQATELPQVHRVIEGAFNEWPERQPFPFEDWSAAVPERRGFEPWQMRVVTGPDGTIVGACTLMLAEHTAYVDQLAVCRAERGRGLAQALLADGFANGRDHGATVSELSTDSRTGALPLYERLGMVLTQTWHHWQIDVTPVGSSEL
jgi:GNAT superfamily N-acetyltransferase